ncbi:MAG: cell division protein FtsA [bacterium]|nr:cell division protein FtsA [bacterium]
MNEHSRYIAGVDIGTTTVRSIVASLDSHNQPTIVGISQYENTGMKKGIISHLEGPAKAVDESLIELENISGYQIGRASFSINGSHLLSNKVEGMIALASSENRVLESDIERLREVSTIGKIPANRETIDFIPYSYILDGQGGISNPLDMSGSRLEVRANVVSSMIPHQSNIEQIADLADLEVNRIIPSVMAAGRAVLTEKQRESGVAVIDLGATTTGIAIYEDGDLQYLRVIPIGGVNITNDLAICLKITPEIAEEIKLRHAIAGNREQDEDIMVKKGREHYSFNTSEIDEIIQARLEEIFEEVRKEFKRAGFDKQLPSGVVLVGGGANMKNIAEYSKSMLELASQVGEIHLESTVSDEFKKPEYAAAVGLMLEDMRDLPTENRRERAEVSGFGGIFAKIFGKKR